MDVAKGPPSSVLLSLAAAGGSCLGVRLKQGVGMVISTTYNQTNTFGMCKAPLLKRTSCRGLSPPETQESPRGARPVMHLCCLLRSAVREAPRVGGEGEQH